MHTKRTIAGAALITATAVAGLTAGACGAESHAASSPAMATQVGGAHVTLGTYVGDGYVLVDLDPATGTQLQVGPTGVQVIQYGDALPACASEDASGPCFWNAAASGNGAGHSFYVDASGALHYVD